MDYQQTKRDSHTATIPSRDRDYHGYWIVCNGDEWLSDVACMHGDYDFQASTFSHNSPSKRRRGLRCILVTTQLTFKCTSYALSIISKHSPMNEIHNRPSSHFMLECSEFPKDMSSSIKMMGGGFRFSFSASFRSCSLFSNNGFRTCLAPWFVITPFCFI